MILTIQCNENILYYFVQKCTLLILVKLEINQGDVDTINKEIYAADNALNKVKI